MQSLLVVQLSGHLCEHLLSTQMSVCEHWLVFFSVQATHLLWVVSQIWCIGSQAAQSEFDLQVTVGWAFASCGQVCPVGAQVPYDVHA